MVLAVVALTVSFMGKRDLYLFAAAVLYVLACSFVRLFLPSLKITLGTSDVGRKKRKWHISKAMLLIYLVFQVLGVLVTLSLPEVKPSGLIYGGLVAALASVPFPSANQVSEGVFRLHNLPKPLLEKLRHS